MGRREDGVGGGLLPALSQQPTLWGLGVSRPTPRTRARLEDVPAISVR